MGRESYPIAQHDKKWPENKTCRCAKCNKKRREQRDMDEATIRGVDIGVVRAERILHRRAKARARYKDKQDFAKWQQAE